MSHPTIFIVLLLAAPSIAQPRDAERAVLPGLIVDAATAPRGARGLPDESRIPGARVWQPLAPEVAARRAELDAARDAAAATAEGAAAVDIPPLSGDAQAPPRLDSGDSDPDRLHSPAPPPAR
jgi:hypothetical protein